MTLDTARRCWEMASRAAKLIHLLADKISDATKGCRNFSGACVMDRSVEAGDIKNSVVVTGDGNAISLNFGDSGLILPLQRKQIHAPRRKPPGELDIMNAESGLLRFIGREDLLANLRAWLDDDIDISARALIGEAGSGKTRLAIELCRSVDPSPQPNNPWIAGFLASEGLQAAIGALETQAFHWKQNTLLVIDYAARSAPYLGRWLDRLAATTQPRKLRFLLLERQAPEGFGWWRELTQPSSHSSAARRDLFSDGRPDALPGLADLAQRRALMAAALNAGRKLHPSHPSKGTIPEFGANPAFDARLSDHRYSNPLSLAMAGVLAVEQGPAAALALRHLETARHFARRELERWKALADKSASAAMTHLAGFNALTGGLPVAGLRGIVADELKAANHEATSAAHLAALLEQDLSPNLGIGSGTLATIEPDLIGEGVIIEAFTGPQSVESEAAEVVARAYGLTKDRSAATLMRLAQDYAYAAEDPDSSEDEKATAKRILAWLHAFANTIAKPIDLMPLAAALPWQTTILREFAMIVTARMVQFFRLQAVDGTAQDLDLLAGWISNLAYRFSNLGRREEALEVAREAVEIRRTLSDYSPDEFRPGLAISLHNLAIGLFDLGKREESLKVAFEAVEIRRALAEQKPEAFRPDLAGSINNLASFLREIGRLEEALEKASEAVEIRRTLVKQRPNAFLHDLVAPLINLANCLSDLGRREAALATVREAVDILRTLAEQRPDAFRPELAISLNNLSNFLGDLGRREEALNAVQEAVKIRRSLAEQRPDAFRPDLAGSLNNLANCLSDLGRREEALEIAREALEIRRVLVEQRPENFSSEIATSLSSLASLLCEVGQRERALEAAREAVDIYRDLAEQQPTAHRPRLATLLINLAKFHGDLGNKQKALRASREAVEILRELNEQSPEAFLPDLATSLNNLATFRGDLGQLMKALETANEAVEIRRTLAEQLPDAFGPDLAISLNNLANFLSELGRLEEAQEPASEAVAILRTLAKRWPDTFRPNLATSLNNLSGSLSALGRREEALETACEALEILRDLAGQRPDAFRPDLAGSLNNLATLFSDIGQQEEALEIAREAMEILRALANERPEAFAMDLATSLGTLSMVLKQMGDEATALDALKEAIEWLSPVFLSSPQAAAQLMAMLVNSYLERCEALSQEPDAALLAPIIETFQRLQAGDKDDE